MVSVVLFHWHLLDVHNMKDSLLSSLSIEFDAWTQSRRFDFLFFLKLNRQERRNEAPNKAVNERTGGGGGTAKCASLLSFVFRSTGTRTERTFRGGEAKKSDGDDHR